MKTFDKPTLITVTAPTCAGKNFLIQELEKSHGFSKIVSSTSRKPRPGEVHGKDYYFVSPETFNRRIAQNEFIEYNTYNGAAYGVTKTEFNAKTLVFSLPIMILDPNGVQAYKELCNSLRIDIFTIYVSTLESSRIERLVRRTVNNIVNGQDPDLTIADHMKRYASIIGEERRWSNTNVWDAVVPGDNIEEAVRMIEQGITWRNQKNASIGASRLNRFVP